MVLRFTQHPRSFNNHGNPKEEHQMTHYYDDHAYTPEQAAHANDVVLNLIKKRRFFLHKPDARKSRYDFDYGLNPGVFADAIHLDTQVHNIYADARRKAIQKINSCEKSLGIVPPDLKDNRQLVVCNRHGGGFEICQVYPLTVFAKVAPKDLTVLGTEMLDAFINGKPLDEIAPKTMSEYRRDADTLANRIWMEFEQLDLFNPLNHRCVVLLESTFVCLGFDDDDDFANSYVADMQQTPSALGYLFWKFSQETRIIQHHHIVFNTSRISHVNVQHWKGENTPKIRYDAKHDYDCPVMFATAL